jgi:hypothetical protein
MMLLSKRLASGWGGRGEKAQRHSMREYSEASMDKFSQYRRNEFENYSKCHGYDAGVMSCSLANLHGEKR